MANYTATKAIINSNIVTNNNEDITAVVLNMVLTALIDYTKDVNFDLFQAITNLGLKIGDLSNLNTTDKTSLVNAINEVLQGGGGGGTPTAYNFQDTNTVDMTQAGSNVTAAVKISTRTGNIISELLDGVYASETLTSFDSFELIDKVLTLKYTDELDIQTTRSIDLSRLSLQIRYNPEIIGLRDGVNKIFTIDDKYKPGTLKVYFNGVLLTKGNDADFIEKDAGLESNGAVINRVISSKDKLIFEFEKWD